MPKRRQSESATEVFLRYGEVMLAVQTFEWHLSFLRLLYDAGESRSTTSRHFTKQLLRVLHATHRASASESRNQLRAHLDATVIEEISRLIEWRDSLAHAYLRERLRRTPDGAEFAPGTAAELRRLDEEFTEGCLMLEEHVDAASADLADELAQISPEDAVALEDLGKRMFHRTPRSPDSD